MSTILPKKKEALRLDNWSVTNNMTGYIPPECVKVYLQGFVWGHPHLGNSICRTSSIQEIKGRFIKTRNTLYYLGKIDPKYRRWLKQNKPDWDWRKPIIKLGESK